MKLKLKYTIIITFIVILSGVALMQTVQLSNRVDRLSARIGSVQTGVEKFEMQIIQANQIAGELRALQDSIDKVDSYKLPQTAQIITHQNWKMRETWSKVEEGMSSDEVNEILGMPTSEEKKGKSISVKFYEGLVNGKGLAWGSVQFRNGKVTKIKPIGQQ